MATAEDAIAAVADDGDNAPAAVRAADTAVLARADAEILTLVSGSEDVPSGAGTTLDFDTEDRDDGDWYDAGASTTNVVVDFAGQVEITANLLMTETAATLFSFSIAINAGSVGGQGIHTASAWAPPLSASIIYTVAVDDIITLSLYHEAGQNRTCDYSLAVRKIG